MNAANLDLCRELHELSGWHRTVMWWVESSNGEPMVKPVVVSVQYRDIVPAYDLGYLIRKAGSGAGVIKNFESYTARRPVMLGAPENEDPLNGRIGWDADTPEDAMCTMLIELHKNGILTKEM